MSKVVHLSDEAHSKAKSYCKEQGLKMSDWVATLIDAAITGVAVTGGSGDDNIRTLVQKKKTLENIEEPPAPTGEESSVPAYAAPPFWAKANGR